MTILAVSDMHGDLSNVFRLLEEEPCDALLCCGDWGDPGQLTREQYERVLDMQPVYTVFGNHDDISLLKELRNRDGSPVLLTNGQPVDIEGISLVGISGIWAKSHRLPWYVTDEEVAQYASFAGSADILLTHGCAVGLNDLTPANTHGGHRCFTEAVNILRPRAHICGHLHRPQVRQLKMGTWAANVGHTGQGDYLRITTSSEEWKVELGRISGTQINAPEQ